MRFNKDKSPCCPLCGTEHMVFLGKIAERVRKSESVWLFDYGCKQCRKSNVLVATRRNQRSIKARWFGDIVGWNDKHRIYFIDLT